MRILGHLPSVSGFLLTILIAIIFAFSTFTALNPIFCFFISFFGLGLPLIILISNKGLQLGLLDSVLDSLFVSLLISVSIALTLSAFNLNGTRLFQSTCLSLFVILLLVATIKRRTIKIDKGKEHLLFFLFLVVFLGAYVSVNSYFDKSYTPDEAFYLINSLGFVQHGYLTPVSFIPLRSFSDILVGRFSWQAVLASFIESTGNQLPYYVVNVPFLAILLSSTFALLRSLFHGNFAKAVVAWLIAALNPLIFVFSHFVLTDLAFTALSLLATYWFIRSFERGVNVYRLVKCFAVAIFSLTIKFNPLPLAVFWFSFTYLFIRNRYYRISGLHRVLFLVVTLPVIAYELFLDVPAIFTYYILHDLELNALFARYVFFSPLGNVISFFFRTPFSLRTWYDLTTYDKLFYLFNILSPELMTPLIVAFTILYFLVIRKDRVCKIYASLALATFLITFIGSLSALYYWDIQRDTLSVILLLEIMGLVAFITSLEGRREYIYASLILMQIIIYLDYLTLANKGFTFYLWGTKLENSYDYLLLMNVLQSSLASLLILMARTSPLQLKLLPVKMSFKPQYLLLVAFSILLIGNNIYITSYGLNNDTYFTDHGVGNVATYANTLEGEQVLVSNIYSLPLYARSNDLIYVSQPLSSEDFNALLKSNLEGKIILSTDYVATYVSNAVGSNEYLVKLPPIITSPKEKTGNSFIPTFDEGKRILFHLSLVNSSQLYTPYDNELNFSVYGSPTWRSENGRNVMYFDGADDYIVVSGKPIFNPLHQLSVEVWFKTDKAQIGKFLIMGGYGNGTYAWGVYLSTNSSRMSFNIRGQKIYNPIVAGRFDDGLWHQFVGVFDGKNITVYLDGKPVKTATLSETITISPSDGFKIWVGSWSGRNSFEGYIGSVNVYEDALGPTDVVEQYLKALGPSGMVVARVVNTSRDYTVYNIYGKNIRVPAESSTTIENASVRPFKVSNSFNYTALSIALYSERGFNGTLILNTNYFSIIRSLEVKEGYNHINLTFPNTNGSRPIGIAIGKKTEILVFDNEGNLLANTIVSSTILKGMQLLYVLTPILLLLSIYVQVSRKENKLDG